MALQKFALAESHCWIDVELDNMDTRQKLDNIYGTAFSHPSLWLADGQQQLAALVVEETEARQCVVAESDAVLSAAHAEIVQARWTAAAVHAIKMCDRLKFRCTLCGTPCSTRCSGCHTIAFCASACC